MLDLISFETKSIGSSVDVQKGEIEKMTIDGVDYRGAFLSICGQTLQPITFIPKSEM